MLEATFRSFYGTDLFLGELLAAEDPERAHAETAVEELLDERNDRDDHDRVEEEGRELVGAPLVRDETLLLAAVEDRLECCADDEREDDDERGIADPARRERA